MRFQGLLKEIGLKHHIYEYALPWLMRKKILKSAAHSQNTQIFIRKWCVPSSFEVCGNAVHIEENNFQHVNPSSQVFPTGCLAKTVEALPLSHKDIFFSLQNLHIYIVTKSKAKNRNQQTDTGNK